MCFQRGKPILPRSAGACSAAGGCLSQLVQDLIKSDSWMKEHKYPKLKHAIKELKAGHK